MSKSFTIHYSTAVKMLEVIGNTRKAEICESLQRSQFYQYFFYDLGDHLYSKCTFVYTRLYEMRQGDLVFLQYLDV